MNKLEQAARQALEALECWDKAGYVPFIFARERAIIALQGALAEQADVKESLTTQEPVAWMNKERNTITWNELYPNMTPLYAAPVLTKDLTDGEVEALAEQFVGQQSIALCRAVIAADREKNKCQ